MTDSIISTLISMRHEDRPPSLQSPEAEHLLSALVILTGEVSVLTDRIMRLEHQLAEQKKLSVEEMRETPLSPKEVQEQSASSKSLIERVFQSITSAYHFAAASK